MVPDDQFLSAVERAPRADVPHSMHLPGELLSAIGKTPIVRLNRLPKGDSAEVWLKLEGTNPTGSMKDRMALSMIEGAERNGQLHAGDRVVEMTGGSTGSSLAMVCAVKRYPAYFVTSDAIAGEKIRTMRAYGATVEIVPSPDGKSSPALSAQMLARVTHLAQEPGTYWPKQFENPDNPAGYHAMAAEIADRFADKLDAFVMAIGTGGCFSGNAVILKERVPRIRCVAVEPAASRNLSGGPPGAHRIEGTGVGFIPKIARMDLVDEIQSISDEEAIATTRRLATEEGILVGVSSGANVAAALEVASHMTPGQRVVTVGVDTGLKYLAGATFL